MSSTATQVDAAIGEIEMVLDEMRPQHEGLRDFERLNLQPETMSEVQQFRQVYDRRVANLERARAALLDLLTDGYPNLPDREVAEVVHRELAENAQTIAAALEKFEARVLASSLNPSAQAPVPKE